MSTETTATTESDHERTIRRISELTAYRHSPTYARIAELQKSVGQITEPDELLELRDSIDLEREATLLSPLAELRYLLEAETLFTEIRNPGAEKLPISDSLDDLRAYGEFRREKADDPGVWLEYQVLSGMHALQNKQKAEAEGHLNQFESVVKDFNFPPDVEYVADMRRDLATGDDAAAATTFSRRMAAFFPTHFDEIQEALERKIAVMTAMSREQT